MQLCQPNSSDLRSSALTFNSSTRGSNSTMGERNVDLSAYVPPNVKGDRSNTGSFSGGQLQVELDDEDDHFGGGPAAPRQAS